MHDLCSVFTHYFSDAFVESSAAIARQSYPNFAHDRCFTASLMKSAHRARAIDLTTTPAIAVLKLDAKIGKSHETHMPMYEHFWTTSATGEELPHDLWGAECETCRVLNQPFPNSVEFVRYIDGTGEYHYWSADPGEAVALAKNYGYRREGLAGHVFNTPRAGTVPLYKFFNIHNRMGMAHFISTAKVGEILPGFDGGTIIAYVFPADVVPAEPALQPLVVSFYRYRKLGGKFCVTLTNGVGDVVKQVTIQAGSPAYAQKMAQNVMLEYNWISKPQFRASKYRVSSGPC